MSAYSVGSTSVAADGNVGRLRADPPSLSDGLGVIVKWVPGEVIGAYGAVVVALQTNEDSVERTSWSWVVGFAIAAAVMTALGALVKRAGTPTTREGGELLIRMVLAAGGFVLWSFVVPGSATGGAVDADVAAVVVPLLALMFGLLAEVSLRSWVLDLLGFPER